MVDRITIGRRRYREARVVVTIGHGKDLNSTYIYIYVEKSWIYIYVGKSGIYIYVGNSWLYIYV